MLRQIRKGPSPTSLRLEQIGFSSVLVHPWAPLEAASKQSDGANSICSKTIKPVKE